MTRVPPRDRNLAFVFQETAMFPNLSVRRNISFGLDMRKRVPQAEIDRRVAEAARFLRIEHLLDRRPHQLSGGQGQRVALGRAMVCEPEAFLLDEPLAALDAALRVEMRTEIKLIQRRVGRTMIFVTHDQEEALTLGDKIAVMHNGVVQQVGTPHEVYHRPANMFVGSFIGLPQINRFDCELHGSDGDFRLASPLFDLAVPPEVARRLPGASSRRITLGLRPEFVEIVGPGNDGITSGTVKLVELMGSRSLVLVDRDGQDIRVLVQGAFDMREGEAVVLRPDLARAFYFDESGRNLLAA